MSQADPADRSSVVREGLRPAHFLVGDWVGAGQSYGQGVQVRLRARLAMDHSFVEVAEVQRDATGQIEHEDRCLYRFDPVEKQLRVHHFSPVGQVSEVLVVALEGGGLRWYAGPLAPSVTFRPGPQDTLRVQVRLPDEPAAAADLVFERQPPGPA